MMSLATTQQQGVRAAGTVRRGAKALITTGERVLLVKERHADGTTFWTLPGGGVEPGESGVAALRRELAEELSCHAAVGDRVDRTVYAHRSDDRTLSLYDVYSCRLCSRVRPVPGEGILDARWVEPGDLPARTIPQVRSLTG
jgi:8-oxo-dGTP pyrophosphatase MutT (NUDIX family)